ncbi:MAG TPA: tetratricopeptide repeat protein [Candidatus Kapabacteria bacterium]|nr:tetratricopeptide repeat protein [Candidatus Kapabacteria bacterium]
MIKQSESENDRQSETLCYFFRHKLFKYIFMVLDDQRILEYLIVKVQVQLEQGGKKILKFPLSEDDHYVYRQVKDFLESNKESACDGLIITGLNALIYRHGAKAIELLNTSRDAFSRFRLPIVFVVNLEILKRIIRGAPDLYNMRDLPDLQFEGTWVPPDMDVLAPSFRDYSQHELTSIDLKIQLIEEQLKRTQVKGKIDGDGLNNMVIPLLILYLEQGNLKKMKSLYQRYIKGNEHRVKDNETLDRYRRKTAKQVNSIEVDKKYIEDRIESRRHFIQSGEWDKAAEITFELEEYLTLHGFPQRSMELLMELEDKELTDKNRSIVFHLIGMLLQGFGDYDAALNQYQKSLEIAEKMGYIKGVAISLGQMGHLYFVQNQFETAMKLFCRAFLIFSKIGSPYAKQAKELIAQCREKMTEEQFMAILKENGVIVEE